jgi:hypothetical protein
LLLVVFLILTGVRWNLSVVLICISFIARESEHFFHYSRIKEGLLFEGSRHILTIENIFYGIAVAIN